MTSDRLRAILTADVLRGAQALLGATLECGELRARIVETEAYRAADDPGSHAHRGRTPRNGTMFGEAGHAYNYFNYGIHWMRNVSAHAEGEAAGILIRAAIPMTGLDKMRERRGDVPDRQLLSGPGKLTRAFSIDQRFEAVDLLDLNSELRILSAVPAEKIVVDRRIGLAEGKGEELMWRFLDAEARPWWSRPLSRHAIESDSQPIQS